MYKFQSVCQFPAYVLFRLSIIYVYITLKNFHNFHNLIFCP